MFFDCHIHKLGNESGGLIIGLEGTPQYPDTLSNSEVLLLHKPNANYVSFVYVCKERLFVNNGHRYLKYHPQREHYTPEEVIESIVVNNPIAVIIDTLNEPNWISYDYWKIASLFPDISFILAHAGGYLAAEFVKICNFQKNVWIDFSLTHSVIGMYGSSNGLHCVNDAIHFALNSHFNNRILLGSDYPFYSQNDVINYYMDYIKLLNGNYLHLLEVLSDGSKG